MGGLGMNRSTMPEESILAYHLEVRPGTSRTIEKGATRPEKMGVLRTRHAWPGVEESWLSWWAWASCGGVSDEGPEWGHR